MKSLKKSLIVLVVMAGFLENLPATILRDTQPSPQAALETVSWYDYSPDRVQEQARALQKKARRMAYVKKALVTAAAASLSYGMYALYVKYNLPVANDMVTTESATEIVKTLQSVEITDKAILEHLSQKTFFGIQYDGSLKDLCKTIFLFTFLSKASERCGNALWDFMGKNAQRLSMLTKLRLTFGSDIVLIEKIEHNLTEIQTSFYNLAVEKQTLLDQSYKTRRLARAHEFCVRGLESYVASKATQAFLANDQASYHYLTSSENGVASAINELTAFLKDYSLKQTPHNHDVVELLATKLDALKSSLSYLMTLSFQNHS